MKSLIACAPVFAILVSGCGVTEPPGGFPAAPDGFPVAWMVTSCSPVDGPAVELYLGEAVPGESSNPSGPHLRIAIDRRAEAVRGNRYTLDDDPPSIFLAQHCVDRDQFHTLSGVAVEFDDSVNTTHEYTGHLQITLRDGSNLQGGFHAELHQLLILCG
jgi:hypothetical protein